jgi:hypothetical protein
VLCFDCLVCFRQSHRERIFQRSRTPQRGFLAAFVVLLWPSSLHASVQVPTITTISITTTDGTPVTSVASGTVVVLTAGVTQTSMEHPNVALGTVKFCDPNAAHCQDVHLIGSAQLTSNGTAVYKFTPAPGELVTRRVRCSLHR